MKTRSLVVKIGLICFIVVTFASAVSTFLIYQAANKRNKSLSVKEAILIGKYVSSFIVEQKAYDYLIPFWIENQDSMPLVHDNPEYVGRLIQELNEYSPILVAANYLLPQEFEKLPLDIKRKFAAYLFLSLEMKMNRLKSITAIPFLGIVVLDGDKMITLVNAAGKDQERGSKYGQVFPLGFVEELNGGFPIAVKTWETGKIYEEMDQKNFVSEDYSCKEGQVYIPVLRDTKTICMVRINLMIQQIKLETLRQLAWVFVISLGSYFFLGGLIYILIHKSVVTLIFEKERMQGELMTASKIQESFLAPSNFEDEYIAFQGYMKPARECGGDFFDYFHVDDRHIAFVIGDVSGKGVGAALFMAKTINAVRSYATGVLSTAEIIRKTNRFLCKNNTLQMFTSCWIGIYDFDTKKMVCTNAGHEYPFVYRSKGKFEMIKDRHNFIMAEIPDVSYTEYELEFHPGDTFFIYTDGIPEAQNENEVLFGMKGVEKVLSDCSSSGLSSPEYVIDHMIQSVQDFQGKAEQFDDCTMIAVKFK